MRTDGLNRWCCSPIHNQNDSPDANKFQFTCGLSRAQPRPQHFSPDYNRAFSTIQAQRKRQQKQQPTRTRTNRKKYINKKTGKKLAGKTNGLLFQFGWIHLYIYYYRLYIQYNTYIVYEEPVENGALFSADLRPSFNTDSQLSQPFIACVT